MNGLLYPDLLARIGELKRENEELKSFIAMLEALKAELERSEDNGRAALPDRH